eukprot:TRINITY_DN1151_c0_g1_i2.p1 TRINITY_DN1151_c0_g1~~TRINITY_DN1151_c0_g1_i2.p1  ORF type:complete len:446 (+),score=58.76 TRINITY_DN1151_c0_g1_i2:391-1728(+)
MLIKIPLPKISSVQQQLTCQNCIFQESSQDQFLNKKRLQIRGLLKTNTNNKRCWTRKNQYVTCSVSDIAKDPEERQLKDVKLTQQQYLQFPNRTKEREAEKPKVEPRNILVRFMVNYRVHSRQLLCMGGSQLPFGWAFLSITKVPMTWNKEDNWTRELYLPAGMRVEYKYVILERQDWIKIQDDSVAEGMVTIPAPPRFRTGFGPEPPPQIAQIEEKMAIVSWQPGPNRVLQLPTEEELEYLKPGDRVERNPARPRTEYYRRDWKTGEKIVLPEHQAGTREFLEMDENGVIFIDRFDVWGYDDFSMPSVPSPGGAPVGSPGRSINPSSSGGIPRSSDAQNQSDSASLPSHNHPNTSIDKKCNYDDINNEISSFENNSDENNNINQDAKFERSDDKQKRDEGQFQFFSVSQQIRYYHNYHKSRWQRVVDDSVEKNKESDVEYSLLG